MTNPECACSRKHSEFGNTRVGGTRVVDMLSGEQFPRIC
jgi:hypothetical protein